MLEQYEIKALESDLLDYNAWATHAVNEGIYIDSEISLHHKADKCAERMVNIHEHNSGSINKSTIAEKIDVCYADAGYKDRTTRQAEYDAVFI